MWLARCCGLVLLSLCIIQVAAASVASASTSGTLAVICKTPQPASSTSTTTGHGNNPSSVQQLSGEGDDIALRFLILHKGPGSRLSWMKLACDSIGMPCVYVFVSNTTNIASHLTSGSIGVYAGIVSIGSILSSEQMIDIQAYQNKYSVKLAVIGSNPATVSGVRKSHLATTTTVGMISIAKQFLPYSKSVNKDLTLPSNGSVTPVVITDTNVATPAFLITFDKNVYARAVFNATQLHSFGDESADYVHSRAFTALFINWLAPAGLYQGHRRIFVNPQGDDLFSASPLWNPITLAVDNNTRYRATGTDIRNVLSQFQQINRLLPMYSNLSIEMAFNGAGIEKNAAIYGYELYNTVQELQNSMFFVSHFFDHLSRLDNATYDYAYQQISQNIRVAEQLLREGRNSPQYSPYSIITPYESGLFNGNVLRAMKDHGIFFAVGDKDTNPDLPSLSNPYHLFETTKELNGEAGVYLIPRHHTDISYDMSTSEELVSKYNAQYGTSSGYDQVMKKQTDVIVMHLLAYRYDLTMVHQANLRSIALNGRITSLARDLIEGVVLGISKYFTLPVWTMKQDQMVKVWMQRMSMDNGKFSVTLHVVDGCVVGVWTTSTADCVGSISSLMLQSHPNVRQEWYGPEVTSYITQPKGSLQYFTLVSPMCL